MTDPDPRRALIAEAMEEHDGEEWKVSLQHGTDDSFHGMYVGPIVAYPAVEQGEPLPEYSDDFEACVEHIALSHNALPGAVEVIEELEAEVKQLRGMDKFHVEWMNQNAAVVKKERARARFAESERDYHADHSVEMLRRAETAEARAKTVEDGAWKMAERIAELEAEVERQRWRAAEAEALVISHEGHIERLRAIVKNVDGYLEEAAEHGDALDHAYLFSIVRQA